MIWTSTDGLHWQRMAAPQLRMPAGSGTVADITGAAVGGGGILLSGHIATTTVQGHGAGSQTVVTRTPAVWLSTDGGVTWTLAPVPVSHGATNGLAGIAADGTGFVAVRPGSASAGPNAQPDGVVYTSADGMSWRYVSTLTSAYGVQIGMVAGGPGGFAALGRGPGGYMAAFLSADGLSWRSGISFGPAPASVTGATVTAAGTVLVTGARGAAGQPAAVPGPGAARSLRARRERRCCSRRDRFPAQRQRRRRLPQPAGRRGRGRRPAGRLVEAGGSWSPVSWSSSTGNGASTPSASGPSVSGSSAAAPSGSSTPGSSTSGSATSGSSASGSSTGRPSGSSTSGSSCARRGDNSAVRLTRVRRVRDRLSFIRHVGGRSVVWLRVRLTLALRVRRHPRPPRPGPAHPRLPRPGPAHPRLPRPGLAHPRPALPPPPRPAPRTSSRPATVNG